MDKLKANPVYRSEHWPGRELQAESAGMLLAFLIQSGSQSSCVIIILMFARLWLGHNGPYSQDFIFFVTYEQAQ